MHQQIYFVYKKNLKKKTEIGRKKSNCNQFSTIFRKYILMQLSQILTTKKPMLHFLDLNFDNKMLNERVSLRYMNLCIHVKVQDFFFQGWWKFSVPQLIVELSSLSAATRATPTTTTVQYWNIGANSFLNSNFDVCTYF